MNKERRNIIKSIVASIGHLCDQIDDVVTDEECAIQRMPDGIRNRAEFESGIITEKMIKAQDMLLDAQIILEEVNS